MYSWLPAFQSPSDSLTEYFSSFFIISRKKSVEELTRKLKKWKREREMQVNWLIYDPLFNSFNFFFFHLHIPYACDFIVRTKCSNWMAVQQQQQLNSIECLSWDNWCHKTQEKKEEKKCVNVCKDHEHFGLLHKKTLWLVLPCEFVMLTWIVFYFVL